MGTRWYDRILNDPVSLVSISLGICGVVLGIVPLILWALERKKSRLLNQTVEQFAILEQIKRLQEETERKKDLTEAAANKAAERAAVMREDVERRIPNAAMIAYYENTIPYLELEILSLGERLKSMKNSLSNLRGDSSVVSREVARILSDHISKNTGARRRLEFQQLMLILFTSISAVILTVLPYPISVVASIPVGITTISICIMMVGSARAAYPESKLLSMRLLQPRALPFVVAAALLMLVIIGLGVSLALRY